MTGRRGQHARDELPGPRAPFDRAAALGVHATADVPAARLVRLARRWSATATPPLTARWGRAGLLPNV
jgi:hypothetical protein